MSKRDHDPNVWNKQTENIHWMRIFESFNLHRIWLHNWGDQGNDTTTGICRRNDNFVHLLREVEGKRLLTKYKLV